MTATVQRVRFFLSIACVAFFGLLPDFAFAQSYPGMPPGMQMPPGMSMPPGMPMPNGGNSGRRGARQNAPNQPAAVRPPGVPISMDSAPMKAFLQQEQHSSYRTRMAFNVPDPMMAQMLAPLGVGNMET